jgi:hypothetical protein
MELHLGGCSVLCTLPLRWQGAGLRLVRFIDNQAEQVSNTLGATCISARGSKF